MKFFPNFGQSNFLQRFYKYFTLSTGSSTTSGFFPNSAAKTLSLLSINVCADFISTWVRANVFGTFKHSFWVSWPVFCGSFTQTFVELSITSILVSGWSENLSDFCKFWSSTDKLRLCFVLVLILRYEFHQFLFLSVSSLLCSFMSPVLNRFDILDSESLSRGVLIKLPIL